MSNISRLTSVPWHKTTLRMEEGDQRRHKANCYYIEDKYCKCVRSNYMNKKCGGSSQCKWYKVKEKTVDAIKYNSEPYWY